MKLIVPVLFMSVIMYTNCTNSGDEDEEDKGNGPGDLQKKTKDLGPEGKGKTPEGQSRPKDPDQQEPQGAAGRTPQGAEGPHPKGAEGGPIEKREARPRKPKNPNVPRKRPPIPSFIPPEEDTEGDAPGSPTSQEDPQSTEGATGGPTPPLVDITLDTKKKHLAEHTIFRAKPVSQHVLCHEFTPEEGFIYKTVLHNEMLVWTSPNDVRCKKVTLCNIGKKNKTMHLELDEGTEIIMKKKDNRWSRKK